MNFIIAITLLFSSVYAQNDTDILQYALILENLENAFYTEGMQKFGKNDFVGFPLESKKVYQRFFEISNHEQTHVIALNSTIASTGSIPYPPCEYNFEITDVKDFVAKALALEKIGTSAYLGQAALVSANNYKTVAVSINIVEALHTSFLRTLNNLSGFPNSFETPLTARSVITIASSFIKSCPFDIPIKPFPVLKLNKDKANVGDQLYFENSNATFCSFSYDLSTVWSTVSDNTTCTVPESVYGDTYVHLTSDNTTAIAKDTSVLSGPAYISVKMSDEMMRKMKGSEINSSSMMLTTSIFMSLLFFLYL
jgi:hypothetical protein